MSKYVPPYLYHNKRSYYVRAVFSYRRRSKQFRRFNFIFKWCIYAQLLQLYITKMNIWIFHQRSYCGRPIFIVSSHSNWWCKQHKNLTFRIRFGSRFYWTCISLNNNNNQCNWFDEFYYSFIIHTIFLGRINHLCCVSLGIYLIWVFGWFLDLPWLHDGYSIVWTSCINEEDSSIVCRFLHRR